MESLPARNGRRRSALWVLALLAGCRLNTTPPGGLAEQKNLSVVGDQLRIKVRALTGPYVGAIEHFADQAATRCGSAPAIRMSALQWKLSAIPQVQDALFQPDPLVALLDGWAYGIQMHDWLESHAGEAAFGECRHQAASAMEGLTARARKIADEVAPDRGQKAEDIVRRWAEANPLPSLFLPRSTIAPAAASQSARQDLGALAAVGTIVETLDDLTARIAAYRQTLLKEAAWTGELAALRASSGDVARHATADVDRIAAAMERIGRLAERLPAVVERERVAGVEALRGEREQILRDIDRQRSETLALLQSERAMVLDQMDAMSRTSIDRIGSRTEGVVDRAFLRAAQLAIGILGAAAIAAVLVAWALGFRFRSLRPRHA